MDDWKQLVKEALIRLYKQSVREQGNSKEFEHIIQYVIERNTILKLQEYLEIDILRSEFGPDLWLEETK